MKKKYIFESKRLGFRLWSEDDKLPFAKMNSNIEVMEFMPKLLSFDESNEFISRIKNHFDSYGYGLWAVDIKETGKFIGFIGFSHANFESDFTPCIEIGWRLDRESWNNGFATEGAKECLKYGFEVLNFKDIFSFTSKINYRSINVMEKIGLCKSRDFNHPKLENGNPLRPHVLYQKRNNILLVL